MEKEGSQHVHPLVVAPNCSYICRYTTALAAYGHPQPQNDFEIYLACNLVRELFENYFQVFELAQFDFKLFCL